MIINATDIIESVSLVDTIQKFVDLKRQGANYVGKSPWKDEKTASFVVSPAKNIYKCFASGHGGNNAAQFLMDYKNMTFPEAVEYLAQESHVLIQYSEGSDRSQEVKKYKEQRSQKEAMAAALKKAHDFYRSVSIYSEDDNGLITIAGKSYTPQSVAKWEFVTAGDFNTLEKASKSWPERQHLIDAGLLRLNKAGSGYFDFFHHRLCFPLYDHSGILVGYNGRILEVKEGDKAPKYLNSQDSLVFNKSTFLFGYHQNWREIRRLNIATLVEGPTDVIIMDQYGISNGLCSSGTAFTYDQAKIIARAADMVIIMYDADEAGTKATKKAIRYCLIAQLDVKVRILPEDHDPASYLASEGKEGYEALPAQDGIEWFITHDFPDPKNGSPTDKAGALLRAAELIGLIKSDHIRDQYCTTISKLLGVTSKVLKDAVQEQLDIDEEKRNRLTPEQEQQKMAWSIYIDKKCYRDTYGQELSNFIIKPLFLVSYNNNAKRVFQIMNKYDDSKFINMDSDEFITLTGFKKATERLGNFIFKGNEAQYTRIREWIYSDMHEVFPVETLGYQRDSGIYAWSNGITLPGSTEFKEVDEFGIVEHDKVKYFLPTFSKINLKRNLDPMENEFEKCFKWNVPPSGSRAPKNLEGWCNAMYKLFGSNAIIAIGYVFASVFRDYLHNRYDMVPHLNLFGPAGSGKTFMAQILTSVFGKPMRATHLVSSSEVAFYRRIAQSCNAIVWYEEYSEKVNPQKQEALKNFADGFGRITGKMTNDTQTKATPVLNTVIISGQILPSHDPALLERCITLYFEKFVGSKDQSSFAEQFKSWCKDGYFPYVAAEAHSMRPIIEDTFEDVMEETRDFIRDHFAGNEQPASRVLNNFAMIAAVTRVIGKKIKLPFKDAQLWEIITDRIREQSRAVEGAEEISGFWSTLVFLMERGRHADTKAQGLSIDHYSIETETEVNVKVDETTTKTLQFEQPKLVLYLRLSYAHKLYVKEGKSQGLARVLEEGTLKHYLRISKSFIGETKAKRLSNNAVQRCWIFDLEYLPQYDWQKTSFKKGDIDYIDSPEVNTEKSPKPEDPAEGMTFIQPQNEGEIPF